MATVTGITAAKAIEVLGKSIVSGAVNSAGHLILTRDNGQQIDAGDFSALVTAIASTSLENAVATAVPNYIAGKSVNRGNISGALSFADFTNVTLINGMLKGVLTGNVTLSTVDLPSAPKANTQFVYKFQQDATGGRTLSLTGFLKSQGSLVLTTTAGAIDIVVFFYDGSQWYAGFMGVDFK